MGAHAYHGYFVALAYCPRGIWFVEEDLQLLALFHLVRWCLSKIYILFDICVGTRLVHQSSVFYQRKGT